MKQSTLIKAGYAVMAALAVVTIAAVVVMLRSSGDATAARHTQVESLEAAEAIRDSSALLTSSVRSFVVTGDKQWLQQYWGEVEAGNQTKARDELTTLGTPQDELDLLQQANEASMRLAAAEVRAQRLVLESQGLPQNEMPTRIAQYQLIPSDRALDADAKRELAGRVVFGGDYVAAQGTSVAPVDEFAQTLAARAEAQADSAERAQRLAQFGVVAAAVLLLVTLGAVLHVTNNKIGKVIARYSQTLSERGPYDLTVLLEPDGVEETRVVAESFNAQRQSITAVLQSIESSTRDLEQVAGRLSASSDMLAGSSGETSRSASAASGSASEMSGSVDSVAAGTEEMNASIREIASAAARASEVSMEAVRSAEVTSNTVSQLSESSIRIGEVMKAITSIAEQTNLLALNATIEAARAGEAGKGFAVVAGEVKDLAQQSAAATDDISEKVLGIQTDAQATSMALAEISEVIARINETQSTIASAVEEQTATTSEMSRSVHEAAGGARGIAEAVRHVAAIAGRGFEAADTTRAEAGTLTDLATQISSAVSRFRTSA